MRSGEDWVPWNSPTHPDRPDAPNRDMSITVGWNAAVEAGVTREEMDAWALRSHRNAIAAIDEGRFKEEIVPIETPHGVFAVDEHPRRHTTLEKLASLKVLHPEIEGFSITAGNACGANDGAAALAIASDSLGLPALGYIRSWASVAVDPARLWPGGHHAPADRPAGVELGRAEPHAPALQGVFLAQPGLDDHVPAKAAHVPLPDRAGAQDRHVRARRIVERPRRALPLVPR